MAKAAKPSGKKPVDKIKPAPDKSGKRQTSGPALPTGKAPTSKPTPQSTWGDHLQGQNKAFGASGPRIYGG
jgi:hypothetical protein